MGSLPPTPVLLSVGPVALISPRRPFEYDEGKWTLWSEGAPRAPQWLCRQLGWAKVELKLSRVLSCRISLSL